MHYSVSDKDLRPTSGHPRPLRPSLPRESRFSWCGGGASSL